MDRVYRLTFTDPTSFDYTETEEVRLRFVVIANGIPKSTQLQECLSVDYELDRLLKFYMNVFQYHIPRTLNTGDPAAADDLQNRTSMLKVGFAGLANLAGHSEFIGLRMVNHEESVQQMLGYWFSEDPERKQFREESVLTLRNLSTHSKAAETLFSKYPDVIRQCIRVIGVSPNEPLADDLVRFIANMAQLSAVGQLLVEEKLIAKLLPFLNENFHHERRNLVSHILKTTFRNNADPSILLDRDMELLSYLLLPLAGGEEFTEDEYEKMPIDLQYLPFEKRRDPNPEVRFNLVSCIVNLSSTKQGRDLMRNSNVYLILRELHKFEQVNPDGLAKTAELIEDWVSAVILTDDDDVD